MIKRLKSFWKYYLKPTLLLRDPNSSEGLKLRIEKLKEDKYGK